MPMTMKKTYTADEFYALGLTEPCELINGEIVSMSPSPNIRHQRLSSDIFYEIKHYIRKNKGKCEVFCSPTDVEQIKRNTEKHNQTSRNILNTYAFIHTINVDFTLFMQNSITVLCGAVLLFQSSVM